MIAIILMLAIIVFARSPDAPTSASTYKEAMTKKAYAETTEESRVAAGRTKKVESMATKEKAE